jgi:hypothetical protein
MLPIVAYFRHILYTFYEFKSRLFHFTFFRIHMLWSIRFFISSDLGQQVPQHDVGGDACIKYISHIYMCTVVLLPSPSEIFEIVH